MYLQFSIASGKQIRLCYLILIIVLAIILTLTGLLFSSPIVRSEGNTDTSNEYTIISEKPILIENQTRHNLSDVTFDINYILQNSIVLIVEKNGGGDYTTIQEAINNALDGTTIFIKKGVYNEILTIKKPLILIGESKESTLINPISDKNKYAINIAATNTVISNLSINNQGPGIYTSGIRIAASNVKISNCDIYDNPIGIAIWTSDNTIDNCRFWGCTDEGIALLGTSYSDCSRNIISNCIFTNNCDGIEMQYSSNNDIIDCEFYENTHTAINAIAESNDKNKIIGCNIYNNNVNGIYFSSSSNNQIMDCLISNNKEGNVITSGISNNNEIDYINSYDPLIENTKNNTMNAISNINIKQTKFLTFYPFVFLFLLGIIIIFIFVKKFKIKKKN
jgi:parallel beta-helix repeat protein